MDKAHHYLEAVVVWRVAIGCQKNCSDQTYIVAYWVVEGTPGVNNEETSVGGKC